MRSTTRSLANGSRSHSPTAKTARRPTNRSLPIIRWPTPSRSRVPLVVPDTNLHGVNSNKVFDVTAADVVGYLGETSGASNTDFYSFTAQAGTLINFQLMSAVLTRSVEPSGTSPTDYNQGPFDTYLAIYNSSGQMIASNDDSFQDTDSSIIDLTLPTTGTYYAMVTSSPKSGSLKEPLTGDYELFMYTFATGATPPPATRCTPARATIRSWPARPTTR